MDRFISASSHNSLTVILSICFFLKAPKGLFLLLFSYTLFFYFLSYNPFFYLFTIFFSNCSINEFFSIFLLNISAFVIQASHQCPVLSIRYGLALKVCPSEHSHKSFLLNHLSSLSLIDTFLLEK